MVDESVMFTKVLPLSSVAPIFKLSLPYRRVVESMLHLVNRNFHIVDSAEMGLAAKSWLVSVVPRSCRGKTEFFLKGWKTIAEAYRLSHKDTISFKYISADCIQLLVSYHSDSAGLSKLPPNPPTAMPGGACDLLNYSSDSSSRSAKYSCCSPSSFSTQETNADILELNLSRLLQDGSPEPELCPQLEQEYYSFENELAALEAQTTSYASMMLERQWTATQLGLQTIFAARDYQAFPAVK